MDETKMQLVDWLDDLCVRFIINLPQEELESVERICFQVEEAQWFYEDFIRPLDSSLPSLPLRVFCLRMFKHCPLLAQFDESQHISAYETFLGYKTRVPVRGAIMLNVAMDEVLLVRGWKKGASWSFPRGKINKDEKDLDCAVREAWEETGYNARDAGLIDDEKNVKYIEVTMREQHMKLFVFRGVDMNFPFVPQTRKEIGKIQWYKLSSLPGWKRGKGQQVNVVAQEHAMTANKLYMVAPFLQPLKAWIATQRKLDADQLPPVISAMRLSHNDDGYTTDEKVQLNNVLQDAHARERDPISAGAVVASSVDRARSFGPQQDQSAQMPASDAASELKRLLSVGVPTQFEEHKIAAPDHDRTLITTDDHGATLLALLRKGANNMPSLPSKAPTAVDNDFQRHVSFEGDRCTPMAPISHRDSDDLPLLREHALQSFRQLDHQKDARQQNIPSGSSRDIEHFGTSQPQELAVEPFLARQVTRAEPGAHTQAAIASVRQFDGVGSVGGDPVADSSVAFTNGNPSSNLSKHALGLLSVLKAPRPLTESQGPSALGVVKNHDKSMSALQRLPGHPPQEDARSRRALAQATDDAQRELTPSQSKVVRPGSLDDISIKTQRTSTQQAPLLSLFHGAPTSKQPHSDVTDVPGARTFDGVHETAQIETFGTKDPIADYQIGHNPVKVTPVNPLEDTTEPIEMPAVPVPSSSTVKQLFDPRDGKLKAHDPKPRFLARPPSAQARRPQSSQFLEAMTSATVSGPVRTPDFDTAKRHAKSPQISPSIPRKATSQVPPTAMQILKRPVTPMTRSPGPPAPQNLAPSRPLRQSPVRNNPKRQVMVSSTPAAQATQSPSLVTPHILRRPNDGSAEQQLPLLSASADGAATNCSEDVTGHSNSLHLLSATQGLLPSTQQGRDTDNARHDPVVSSDAPARVMSNQNSALLSLFDKAAPEQKPRPNELLLSSARDGPPQTMEKWIKSEDAFGIRPAIMEDADLPKPDAALSGLSSAISGQPEKGTISPVDKGFLLNFLTGFAKSSTSMPRKA